MRFAADGAGDSVGLVSRLPPDGGGGGDLVIDATAMAGAADEIGSGAAAASSARDAVNSAWKMGGTAFGNTPVVSAFDACCQVWVDGTNTIAQLIQSVAQYTQDIANAFGSTDTQLAASASQMYDKSTLPKPGTHYRAPDPRYVA